MATAKDCQALGAAVIHLHVRDAETRPTLDLPRGAEQAAVQAAALADARVSRYVNGGAIRKAIYVKDKLLNLVVG